MTQEQRERLMAFILAQQAATEAKLEQLAQQQAKAEVRMNRRKKYVAQLVKASRRILTEPVPAQADIQPPHQALAEAQKRTEENLRRLTLLMERHPSQHQ